MEGVLGTEHGEEGHGEERECRVEGELRRGTEKRAWRRGEHIRGWCIGKGHGEECSIEIRGYWEGKRRGYGKLQ